MHTVTDFVFHFPSLDLQIWTGPLPKALNEYDKEGGQRGGGQNE